MQANKIQLRGHCQVCGNEQAVVRTTMSKHGYSIVNGWFSGVCHGQHHQPIEVSRDYTDKVIAQIKVDIENIKTRIAKLVSGEVKPETFQVWNYQTGKYETKPANELSAYEYKYAFNHLMVGLENTIRRGELHIDTMTRIANEFHGKPLREVNTEANKPEAIKLGEQRILSGRGTIGTVYRIEGARVYYKYAGVSTGKEVIAWQGSRAWRNLELVA
jgi:hypothetical protein